MSVNNVTAVFRSGFRAFSMNYACILFCLLLLIMSISLHLQHFCFCFFYSVSLSVDSIVECSQLLTESVESAYSDRFCVHIYIFVVNADIRHAPNAINNSVRFSFGGFCLFLCNLCLGRLVVDKCVWQHIVY
jgi:hypothetical protein